MRFLGRLTFMLAVLVGFFAAPVLAQEQYTREQAFGQVMGDRVILSNSATTATMDFGFQAEKVRVCFVTAGASDDIVWLRYGHTVVSRDDGVATATADTTGMSILATNDTDFQDGVTLTLGPQSNVYTIPAAMPLSPIKYMGGAANAENTACQEFRFKTRGLIFHSAAASTAELDVWAFGERPRQNR